MFKNLSVNLRIFSLAVLAHVGALCLAFLDGYTLSVFPGPMFFFLFAAVLGSIAYVPCAVIISVRICFKYFSDHKQYSHFLFVPALFLMGHLAPNMADLSLRGMATKVVRTVDVDELQHQCFPESGGSAKSG